MTRREQDALPALLAFIVILLTICAVLLILWGAQHQDEIDRRAMDQAQARSEQVQELSTDAQLRAMVGYDEIKTK